jgi:hypothetical protein
MCTGNTLGAGGPVPSFNIHILITHTNAHNVRPPWLWSFSCGFQILLGARSEVNNIAHPAGQFLALLCTGLSCLTDWFVPVSFFSEDWPFASVINPPGTSIVVELFSTVPISIF